MLTIHLTPEVRAVIAAACVRSGRDETGGMLFGEHLSEDVFRVIEATVAGTGTVASFVRSLMNGLGQLERFFHRTRRDYRRFNYLGEWHSHPSFELYPSRRDDQTMFELVNDASTGARFALSLIVRVVDRQLEVRAFVYYPGDEREDVQVAPLS